MRRIVAFNRVTANGYFAGADGGLGWVVPDEEVDQLGIQGMRGTDTILFGRRTYDLFASFWPHALEDSDGATDPHRPGRRSEAMRAMATWLNDTTKLVFSRTLAEVTWKNARLLRDLDPREIAAMKGAPGKGMILFGSGSIVSQLTEHGLIDEYQFVVCPVVLAGGRPLLSGLSKGLRLDLVEARAFPSGNVLLRYARPG